MLFIQWESPLEKVLFPGHLLLKADCTIPFLPNSTRPLLPLRQGSLIYRICVDTLGPNLHIDCYVMFYIILGLSYSF